MKRAFFLSVTSAI